MWTYHLILPDPGDESLFMWQLWRAAHRDSHLSILEISSAFLIDTSFTWSTVSETAATPTRHHLTFFFWVSWHAPQTDSEPETVDNTVNLSAVCPRKYYQWN